MKKFIAGCLIAAGMLLPLSAETRTNVHIIEATENIRFLSQEIAKDYLYYYANPRKREISRTIRADLQALVKNIRTIAVYTESEETKNMLEFLVYSKNQIDTIIAEKPSKEKAALMLDYSETLLEGANSIGKEYAYNYSENEKMLIKSKQVEFLVERSAKYYLALGAGLDNEINRRQMLQAVKELEQDLKEIENYPYPLLLSPIKERLSQAWNVTKSLIDRRQKLFASNLLVLAGRETESVAEQFVIYHRKAK
ncbi:hypothetical protein [Nitratifractor sp.]|uniref:hypothetical protein n=1 Tax=Nitratifractor sp. TaxID=2268144 RepID=UPI0025F4C637|nr:hypothetical protein [Nitratifractor sp.]